MTTGYNRIAGQSAERLAALSDGVFAVAMTLLVLDLRAPAAEAIHSERDLWRALLGLAPRLLMYMMSFMTLGILWVGQQTQLNHLRRSSRGLTWIHLGFLFVVTTIPFSTSLLAEHTGYRLALLVYWLNIFLMGATLYWSERRNSPLLCAFRPAGLSQIAPWGYAAVGPIINTALAARFRM